MPAPISVAVMLAGPRTLGYVSDGSVMIEAEKRDDRWVALRERLLANLELALPSGEPAQGVLDDAAVSSLLDRELELKLYVAETAERLRRGE